MTRATATFEEFGLVYNSHAIKNLFIPGTDVGYQV
jgi:hypothetical protein